MKSALSLGLFLLAHCSSESTAQITLEDASVALRDVAFVAREIPSPLPPTDPAPPAVPTFAGCNGERQPNEPDFCWPFAMPRSGSCDDASLLYPTARECQPIASCAQSFPDEEGVLFVDDDASVGGIGSHAQPFASINEALAHAPDRSTILVQPGRYEEQLVIDRGISVRGACPATTVITMRGAVSPRSRALVILAGGSLAGVSVIGAPGNPDLNWGGVATRASAEPSHLAGVFIRDVDYGIFVNPNAELRAERIRSYGYLVNQGRTTIERSHFITSASTLIHWQGELNGNDIFLEGASTAPLNYFIGVLAISDDQAANSSTGNLHFQDLVIRIAEGPSQRYGLWLGGNSHSSFERVVIEADEAAYLIDRHSSEMNGVATLTSQRGITVGDASSLQLQNARVIGVERSFPRNFMWEEIQNGIIAFNPNTSISTVYLANQRQFALFRNVLAGERPWVTGPPFTIRDVTIENLFENGPSEESYGIMVPALDAERLSIRGNRVGAVAVRVHGRDIRITNVAGGIVALEADLERIAIEEHSIVGVQISESFGAVSDSTAPGANRDGVIRDARFANGGAAISIEDRRMAHVERVAIDDYRGVGVWVTGNETSHISDARVHGGRTRSQANNGSYASAFILRRTNADVSRLVTEVGTGWAGSLGIGEAHVRAQDCQFNGGFHAIAFESALPGGQVDLHFTNVVARQTPIGVWLGEPIEDEPFSLMRFEQVIRPITFDRMRLPAVNLEEIDGLIANASGKDSQPSRVKRGSTSEAVPSAISSNASAFIGRSGPM